MQVDQAVSDASSSPISSAPVSPHRNGVADTIQVASRPQSVIPGVTPSTSATSAQPQSAATPPTSTHTTTTPALPEKPKRARKKKELGPDGKPIDDGKPKVTKPRKPKEPKTTTNGATTTAAASRKKVKTEEKSVEPSRQPTITETFASFVPSPMANVPLSTAPVPPPLSTTPIARPATSGQKYDPVRGMTMEYARPPPPLAAPTQVNRASASPSIASLIDPPIVTTAITPSALHSPQRVTSQTSVHSPPQAPTQASPSPTTSRAMPATDPDTAMDVDKSPVVVARSSPPAHKGTGSGLLSSSDLFGGPSTGDGIERKGVNIDIQIKLNPLGGNHINVAQEIIKKYGRDAINPRAAAHRERLLQVMAAANKIEGASADDMSIDLMSDAGDDSNVEMGGMDDGSAADGDKPRKRRKKVEEYDLDDEFIDDTELAWQQQAAVAKDGFFVYSGPLVPEGEAARVEAAGTGARGRGGRRGGRGKASTTSTHASLAEKKETVTASPAAAKGRGRARAPAAPRKPRPTKAEKEKADAEKARVAAAAADSAATTAPTTTTITAPAPSTAPVPPPLAPPPT
ncbi:hypothetical protein AMS68_005682 [Peltaster fructicola]|uniref:Hpc2-related domain-containing protein n=1 Tax=Peltaster fructicola TaxID=286661 RepID=A0A6H0XZS3_9PEZI|nr:hypothetical protein AMS68_005682 [Peltaster fructicola]